MWSMAPSGERQMSTLTKLKLANASRKPVEETPQERMRTRMTEHLTMHLKS